MSRRRWRLWWRWRFYSLTPFKSLASWWEREWRKLKCADCRVAEPHVCRYWHEGVSWT